MGKPELDLLQRTCAGIVSATQGQASWEWDDRFGAALTMVATADGAALLSALEASMPARYTPDSLGDAPQVIQDLANGLGGLRSNQILLCSHPEADAFLFGAWWPWGDGQRVSLRIAGVPHGIDGISQDDLAASVRTWFGL